MNRDGLKGDIDDSYQSLKELLQKTRELKDLLEVTDLPDVFDINDDGNDEDYLQSLIDYNIDDVLSTQLSNDDYVDIQIGDMSEDVRRNAVVNIYNYTKDMNLRDVKNLRIDYDGNIELNYISSHLDLSNLVIKNVDVFGLYNMLPNCNVGTIRFENCELAKHYSVRTQSDNFETSLDFIFQNTNAIGKIEFVNCSSDFVDVLLLGIDKVDENHRFGSIEIDIK